MPWLEWQGEVIPCFTDGFENISAILQAPDTTVARQDWYLDVSLMVPNPKPESDDAHPVARDINLRLSLPTQVSDWRELAGVSIHANPAWHAEVASSSPHGRLRETILELTDFDFRNEETAVVTEYKCDRYHLRLGPPNGFLFPLELDAWLEPAEGFDRLLSPDEALRQPTLPPNLRVMASPRFSGGSIDIEAGHPDPLEVARRRLRSVIGLKDFIKPKIEWFAQYERSRHQLDGPVPEADQRRCTVRFSTPDGGA